MKKFPKIMPDPTSKNGFTGMTPADDKLLRYVDGVKRNDPKTLKAIDDYSEQLHYNSTLGQFVKGNKRGSLSDFKNDVKPFEPILDRLKAKGKTKKTKPTYAVIDTDSLSKDLNNYIQLRNDMQTMNAKPVVKTAPVPNKLRTGIFNSDVLYRRQKGILDD